MLVYTIFLGELRRTHLGQSEPLLKLEEKVQEKQITREAPRSLQEAAKGKKQGPKELSRLHNRRKKQTCPSRASP